MPLYLEGIIKLVQVNPVKGKDSTEDFVWYQNFIQYEDREGLQKVLEINSKTDYRDRMNVNGVATIMLRKVKAKIEGTSGIGLKDASLYKATLGDFIPEK